MKKVLILLHIVLLVLLNACSDGTVSAGNTPESQVTDSTDVQQIKATEDAQVSQTAEILVEEDILDETEEWDEQKVMGYLAMLGLDESVEYTVLDQIPIEGSDEKSILMDINSISQGRFNVVIETMEANDATWCLT